MILVIGIIALVAILLPGGQAMGDGQEALFIDTDGNVGIGTTQPGARLDVQGSVNAAKFTGDGSDLKVANVTLAAVRRALDMLVPIGTIMAYGGDVRKKEIIDQLGDEGWLVCNGNQVKRNEYPELFKAVGVSFGAGDGKTTFHLPDMRGRFLRGVDHSKGMDPDAGSRSPAAPGGNTGDAVGSVQDDTVGKHRHMVYSDGCNQGQMEYGFKKGGQGGSQPGSWHSRRTAQFGEGIGHETRPKNISVNWIIKARHVI
jgi:hypothetical protein